MTVPYAHTPRPDTGLTNVRLGTWFFLAANAMFFGALFSSYAFLRTAAPYWPVGRETLPVGLASGATAALIATALAGLTAWRGSPDGQTARARTRALAAGSWAVLAAVLYMGELALVWTKAGPPQASTYLAVFHVLHAALLAQILGAAVAWILISAIGGPAEVLRARLEAAAWFGGFLAVVGLCLAALFLAA